MSTASVQLRNDLIQRLDAFAAATGISRDELANEAVERLLDAGTECAPDDDWKADILQAAGIWKGRDDLPDFQEIRRSMDRDLWSR